MKKIALLIILICCSCNKETKNSQGEDFSNNVDKVAESIIDDSDKLQFFNNEINPLKPAFHPFRSGSVLPKGWILEMMKNDLNYGVVGALAELYPGIKADDLYNTARRGGMEDIPEMGDLVLTGAAWEKSIMWWNAETIGNWWDGYIRHAFLTNDKTAIERSHNIIQNLLASQDDDGYIGIYKPNLRYQHEGSNGELWAQTTAFRTMLAYYEMTNNEEVLEAVQRGMKVTINNYGEGSKNPFYLKNAFGGVTHGLMLTDVCETLFRLTGDQIYNDYATYLYKAFSTYSINRSFNDLRYPYLMEKDSLFEGHAVHTYEHIRTMVNAYYNTGYPELEQAYNMMLDKLEPCILPSGAGHGNEWILKMEAHPTNTSSEYCSMLELRNSYGSLFQKTGNTEFADAAEKLTYNAMLGFRNEDGTAITYGKSDNCYVLDGHHHENDESRPDPRYKYSPTHSEPAVCCVPNYGRNLTYFLDQMYMKSAEDITVMMYGPSKLTTEIEGATIVIEQQTDYPWNDDITFNIKATQPSTFSLRLRKPKWSASLDISLNENVTTEGNFYIITKEWLPEDSFTVKFKNPIQIKTARNEEVYIQKGPLVYAYEIPFKEEVIKQYEGSNYKDYYCIATSEDYKNLRILDSTKFTVTPNTNLKGAMYDTSQKQEIDVILVPMGNTILRRVTFPNN